MGDGIDSGEVLDSRPPRKSPINPDLPVGDQIVGEYRLLDQIGAGGFSIVWKARHEGTGRIVALKFPRVPEFVAHLTREALISSRFQDPQVVGILDAHLDHDPPYLVSPYVPGSDLLVPDEAPPPSDIVLALVRFWKVAEVVARLHVAGVVHGDLKPGNIRFDHDGVCHLLDLGLARHQVTVRQASTLRASIVSVTGEKIAGTLEYMAPEVMSGGRPERAADIYSLGVLLHTMLCGRPPAFGVSPGELNPFLPPGTTDLLRQMLDHDPEQRPRAVALKAPLDELILAEERCLRRRNGHARRRIFNDRMRTLGRGIRLALTGLLTIPALLALPMLRIIKLEDHGPLFGLALIAAFPLALTALILAVTTINAWILGIPEKSYKIRRGHPWWTFMIQ